MIPIPSLAENPPGAPTNEVGDVCPWPYDPLFLVGAPIGQYHCPSCGGMQMAGLPHLDWSGAQDDITPLNNQPSRSNQ